MRNSIITFIIIIFLLKESVSKLNTKKIQLAINCGGDAVTSASGIRYIEDKYYTGGETSNFGKDSEIKQTNDPEVYYTERWSKDDFSYSIPIKGEGSFVLILQFSEVYFTSKNEKVFDVEVNGEKVVKDLDIFDQVGKNAAYDEFIPLEIKKGDLIIKNKKVDFDGKTLNIKFLKKEKDNPKINGIILVKGTIEDTHKGDFSEDSEDKVRIGKEKRSRDFQRMSKSIDYEDFENDFIDDGRFNVRGNGVFSVKGILFGVVIFALGYILFVK